ncbi:unnamed protein product [Oikopleura dioica]|uniref:Uncharacterized protein n=1 Tax=Oikopleura dioica TaxID=34765 RepID=E4WX06_OIKDI|nr:unnamed protein product [Oikopleura dioica]
MKKMRAREKLKWRKKKSSASTLNSFKKNRRSGSSKKSNAWQKKRSALNIMKSKKKLRQLVAKQSEPKNLQPKNMFKINLQNNLKASNRSETSMKTFCASLLSTSKRKKRGSMKSRKWKKGSTIDSSCSVIATCR